MGRQGNRPDRRIARHGTYTEETLKKLAARIRYVGSGVHKLSPGDYNFTPPCDPRPSKDVCDDVRKVPKAEAARLFRRGIELGMVSFFTMDGVPKYVWSVDEDDNVYEAKTKKEREVEYHGYRISDEVDMCREVLKEWGRRCPKHSR
ncbi:MAG: hypothetical protein HQL39_20555 [Alphaproteobacteria bacterium]|nr:hypothetical protein [Alphaproteobacteria bacterium]